jgi:hypothetical protein
MGIHFRRTPLMVMVGVLALGGASVAGAQDTSAAARQDTSGYQPSRNQTDTAQAGQNDARSDSSGYRYNGSPSDTALKAAPGVQTGPTAADSGRRAGQDTSSYRSSPNQTDTTETGVDRTQPSGYKYHGAPTDTTLKAEPGVQTGPTAGDSGRRHPHRHMRMSAMDTVVCKDGSNSANSARGACGSHGGVDTTATWAAMKARGWSGRSGHGMSHDSTASKSDSAASDSGGTKRSSP